MIDSFKGENSFLSNFYPSPVTMDGITYPTVEHAFQAAKTDDQEIRQQIANKATPGKAKRAGGGRGIVKDFDQVAWDVKKVATMRQLVFDKFFCYPDLADQLKATGTQQLIEGNVWNDTFWGVCRGNGQNHLGEILMQVRNELG
jgi:ribA/ribD-fused uncharacterized protein